MTTELYEVYSLEEGDEIIIMGNIYKIVDIESLSGDTSSLLLIDENGYAKTLNANDNDKIRVICESVEA
jgi:hypothetical protein